MSAHANRISTIRVLLAGSPLATLPDYSRIDDELNEVKNVGVIAPLRRRRVFEVFHASRATEAVLRTIVYSNNCFSPNKANPNSIGQYLFALQGHVNPHHGKLSSTERHQYQQRIANKRNQFLHGAGEYPSNQHDVAILLSDMYTCIARSLAL